MNRRNFLKKLTLTGVALGALSSGAQAWPFGIGPAKVRVKGVVNFVQNNYFTVIDPSTNQPLAVHLKPGQSLPSHIQLGRVIQFWAQRDARTNTWQLMHIEKVFNTPQ